MKLFMERRFVPSPMSPPSPSISLRDVARAAGVSLGTASQALRNVGTTSRATRARLQALARAMGYHPDPLMAQAALRHRLGRKGATCIPVGLLMSRMDVAEGPAAAQIATADPLRQRLRELGYSITEWNVKRPGKLPELIRRWHFRGVRGVICLEFEEIRWIKDCLWPEISLLQIGGRYYEHFLHTIRTDGVWGMHLALENAALTGRRIGVLLHTHPDRQVWDDDLRIALTEKTMRQARRGRYVPLQRLSFSTPFEEQARQAAAWFRRHQPEIVIGYSFCGYLLGSQGHQPGRDFQLYCCVLDQRLPDRSGALEPLDAMYRAGAEMLDSMIRHREFGVPVVPHLLSLPPVWVEGVG